MPPSARRARPASPSGRRLHGIAVARQVLHREPAEPFIIIDIEHQRRGSHHFASGTLITEKNRPSCRMALAKFS